MIIKEIKKYKSLLMKLTVLLIILYAFTISFGTVFKPEGDMTPKPLINLSLLTYVITVFCFFSAKSTKYLKANPIINYLFVLAIYLLINTLLFSVDFLNNFSKWISFLANVLLVYFISNIKFKASFLHLLFYTLSIGGLIASILTLIDYFNIIDIPYFNEKSIGIIGFEARGGSGSFLSRTTLGAFYSIIMPISLFSFIYLKRPIYLISFIACFIAMLSTFNRGAPFSVIIVAIIFLIRKHRVNLKTVFIIFLISTIVIIVLRNIFSEEQHDAIKYLVLTTLNVEEKHGRLAESDNFRFEALHQIVTDEMKKNPFGQGFNDFYIKGKYEPISVHSNFNYIIYAAGLFGFIWSIFFLRRLYLYSHMIQIKEFDIIKYSLFSWTLYSLTHMVLYTFLAWLLLGLLLNRHILYEIKNDT